MPLRYLLDTHVVSELTQPQPNAGVLQALAQHEAACAISAPTLEVLVFGCLRLPVGARRDWLRRWFGLSRTVKWFKSPVADARWRS